MEGISSSPSAAGWPDAPPLAVDQPGRRRLLAAAIAVPCAVILGIAAFLTPAGAGHGTHEQLNLPECGWITMADLPCPSCGMTTAFAHAANGDLVASFITQPMGAVLAILTAMTLIVSVYVAVTGSKIASVFGQFLGRSTIWYSAAFAALAWGYKILSHRGII